MQGIATRCCAPFYLQCSFWPQHNILQGNGGELRTAGALPIFGEHRMAL